MQAAPDGTASVGAGTHSLMDQSTKKISPGSLRHQLRSPHTPPRNHISACPLPFLILWAASCMPRGTL